MRTGNAQAWNTLLSQAKITTFKMENTLLSLLGRDYTTTFYWRDIMIFGEYDTAPFKKAHIDEAKQVILNSLYAPENQTEKRFMDEVEQATTLKRLETVIRESEFYGEYFTIKTVEGVRYIVAPL